MGGESQDMRHFSGRLSSATVRSRDDVRPAGSRVRHGRRRGTPGGGGPPRGAWRVARGARCAVRGVTGRSRGPGRGGPGPGRVRHGRARARRERTGGSASGRVGARVRPPFEGIVGRGGCPRRARDDVGPEGPGQRGCQGKGARGVGVRGYAGTRTRGVGKRTRPRRVMGTPTTARRSVRRPPAARRLPRYGRGRNRRSAGAGGPRGDRPRPHRITGRTGSPHRMTPGSHQRMEPAQAAG